jgi:DNA replicative helicase MCM subunit Mcm2 (Cdc46/Mcm family)
MRTLLIANNIIPIGAQIQEPIMTSEDIENIRNLSEKKNVFEILSNSIAPR